MIYGCGIRVIDVQHSANIDVSKSTKGVVKCGNTKFCPNFNIFDRLTFNKFLSSFMTLFRYQATLFW